MLSIALQPEGLQLITTHNLHLTAAHITTHNLHLTAAHITMHNPKTLNLILNSITQPIGCVMQVLHCCSSHVTSQPKVVMLIAQPNRRLGCASFLFLHGPGRKSWAVNSGRKPTRRVGLLVNTWPNPVRGWAVLRVKSTRRVDFTSYLLQSTTLRVVQQALHVAGWREIAAFPLRIYG